MGSERRRAAVAWGRGGGAPPLLGAKEEAPPLLQGQEGVSRRLGGQERGRAVATVPSLRLL